jgi:hypothetical protein
MSAHQDASRRREVVCYYVGTNGFRTFQEAVACRESTDYLRGKPVIKRTTIRETLVEGEMPRGD